MANRSVVLEWANSRSYGLFRCDRCQVRDTYYPCRCHVNNRAFPLQQPIVWESVCWKAHIILQRRLILKDESKERALELARMGDRLNREISLPTQIMLNIGLPVAVFILCSRW